MNHNKSFITGIRQEQVDLRASSRLIRWSWTARQNNTPESLQIRLWLAPGTLELGAWTTFRCGYLRLVKPGLALAEFLMRRVKYRSQLRLTSKRHIWVWVWLLNVSTSQSTHQTSQFQRGIIHRPIRTESPTTVNYCRFILTLFIYSSRSLSSPSAQHPEPGHNHRSA